MSNIKNDIITAPYKSSTDLGKYAKLMEIPIGQYNTEITMSTFNMHFRVYSLTNNGVFRFRDYCLIIKNTTSIDFRVLNTERVSTTVVAHVDTVNDIVTLYSDATENDQSIYVHILHCNAIHRVTMFQFEFFEEDFSTITPTYPDVMVTEPVLTETIFDDFLYQTLTEINTPWILNKGSDDTALDPAILPGSAKGQITLVTGNNSGLIADDGSQIVCSIPVKADYPNLVVETRLYMPNIASCSLNIGLTDTTDLEEPFSINGSDVITSNASNAACIVYDYSALTKQFFACCVNNDVDDTGNGTTGITPVNSEALMFRIEVLNNGAEVRFYIGYNFPKLVKILKNTGISASPNLYFTIVANSTTTTSRSVNVDYIMIRHGRVT